ncbi:MAG: small multi-drug export protein [Oscillospiraceae bacterium]|jgi:uncharacterized membrane protein|nr:small multi-drug export protein [Oscillospiraceae bacterium]
MDLLQWLITTQLGEFIFTILVSMLPVVELRGGIPFGLAAGLPPAKAFAAAFIGNMLPVPFLILFTRRLLTFLKDHVPLFRGAIACLERKVERKKHLVLKYQALGLLLLVAVPLPGTGAWTGSLVAAAMDMRLSKAVPAITGGVLAAGVIITFITHQVALF